MFVDPTASLYFKIRSLFVYLAGSCQNGTDRLKCEEGVIVGHALLWLSWMEFNDIEEQTLPPLIDVVECVRVLTPEDAAKIENELHGL